MLTIVYKLNDNVKYLNGYGIFTRKPPVGVFTLYQLTTMARQQTAL